MKQLRVLQPPPGWDASLSQGYPQQHVADTHFIHLGGEGQCGVKSFVQGNKVWASNHRPSDLKVQCGNQYATMPPFKSDKSSYAKNALLWHYLQLSMYKMAKLLSS